MINREAMKRIEELQQEYKRIWGKDVEYTIIPPGISQEKLVEVLERIVDTGESLLVGWNNIKDRWSK